MGIFKKIIQNKDLLGCESFLKEESFAFKNYHMGGMDRLIIC